MSQSSTVYYTFMQQLVHVIYCTGTQVGLLEAARKQLDPVDKMIDDAKWDAIRNIIKTSPLADVKVCFVCLLIDAECCAVLCCVCRLDAVL